MQFTRNPAGIVGALKKIGGLAWGSRLEATHAHEASHLFFGNGIGRSLFGLMDTHPPLEQRIRAFDPGFDGAFPAVSSPAPEEKELPPRHPQPRAMPPLGPSIIAAQALFPGGGTPTPAHLHYAVQMRDSFPPAVQAAAREPFGASALVYALLLSPEPQLQNQQMEYLSQNPPPAWPAKWRNCCRRPPRWPRAPNCPWWTSPCRPWAISRPPSTDEFNAAAEHVIESDGQIELFEYVLQKMVLRHLDAQFKGARKPIIQYYALAGLMKESAVLLSALAYAGQAEPDKIQAAFQQGAGPLAAAARAPLQLLPLEQCGLEQVDAALDRLVEAVPQIKKNVLNACAQTVAADGVIEEAEAELLRAIAEALDCPLPPFVSPSSGTTGHLFVCALGTGR